MTTTQPVSLTISNSLINSFQKKAKTFFPNECFAFLLGCGENDKIIAKEFYYPNDLENHCRPNCVYVQDKWIKEVKQYARKNKFIVSGSLHSHPYSLSELKNRIPHLPDRSPSEADYDLDWGLVGICVITETKCHQLRARTRFWAPMPQVKVKTTK